jgi:hypothetical protein
MALQDSYPCLVVKAVKSDTASTDAAILPIPYTGSGYAVRRVTVYGSRLGTTGATANGATATLSVRGGAGGTGTSIVADAALTGLTGSTIVLDRTVAATALTPIVTDANLYIRIGTASGVANSVFDVCIEYTVLP